MNRMIRDLQRDVAPVDAKETTVILTTLGLCILLYSGLASSQIGWLFTNWITAGVIVGALLLVAAVMIRALAPK